jgi:hypothetical protein
VTVNGTATAGDGNVVKREAEQILKCKYLTIEIQRMWNVKTSVLPVITEETGNISNIQKMSEQHTWKARYQETTEKETIRGTAHILRDILL